MWIFNFENMSVYYILLIGRDILKIRVFKLCKSLWNFNGVENFYIFIINDLDSIVNILKFDEPKISNACVVNKKQNKCTTTHLISMLMFLWYDMRDVMCFEKSKLRNERKSMNEANERECVIEIQINKK